MRMPFQYQFYFSQKQLTQGFKDLKYNLLSKNKKIAKVQRKTLKRYNHAHQEHDLLLKPKFKRGSYFSEYMKWKLPKLYKDMRHRKKRSHLSAKFG